MEDRFWMFVDKTDTCWNWTGSKDTRGYGRFNSGTKTAKGNWRPILAHRLSYQLHTGKVPILSILHSCDNPCCVNPDHLREGTHRENMKDMKERDRHRPSYVKGSRHGMSKLTDEDVRMIRRSSKTGCALADELGVSKNTIYFIRSGQTWKHVS